MSFDDAMNIDLGGKKVDLYHWGTGDGVATTIIHVPDAQTVSVVVFYEAPRIVTPAMWLDDKNFLGQRAILNRLAGWDLKHVIAGHSTNTGPQGTREQAEFLNDLYDAVRKE